MIKIKYEQLFPTGTYLNCRIGLEKEIENEDDDATYINIELEYLKRLVNEFHQKEFPQFYENKKPIYQGEEEQSPIPGKKIVTTMGFSAYCDKINSCTTIEELKSMKPIADMNPKLVNIYNEKLKTLQS